MNWQKEDKGYWRSEEEMFARAFACYVKDRLPWRNDYLCGHAETGIFFEDTGDGKMTAYKVFPVGEERKRINDCFDRLFAECRERNLLKVTEKELRDNVTRSGEQRQLRRKRVMTR